MSHDVMFEYFLYTYIYTKRLAFLVFGYICKNIFLMFMKYRDSFCIMLFTLSLNKLLD